MLDEKLFQVRDFNGIGFQPMIYFEGWRVAYLCDTPKFHRENIMDMQRHNTSDEVFILVSGDFTLYVGDGTDTVGNVTEIKLEPGVMYNIRKGTWHTHVVSPGTKVVVIENADVSNSDHIPFHF